jgi:hypothetical protein
LQRVRSGGAIRSTSRWLAQHADNAAAVNTVVADLLAGDAMPAGRIYLNPLSAAPSDAGGVNSFELSAPTVDVVSATGHMPVFQPHDLGECQGSCRLGFVTSCLLS